MNSDVKNELAKKAIFRAQSGLYFLHNVVLPHIQNGTDVTYSRSVYILLSFNIELLLSTLFILGSNKTSKTEIIKDLIVASKTHNFESFFDKISQEFRFGIQSIHKKNVDGFVQYNIKIDDSMIIVEDLIDVRYDFKKDEERPINQDEGKELKSSVRLLIAFVMKVMTNSIYFDTNK